MIFRYGSMTYIKKIWFGTIQVTESGVDKEEEIYQEESLSDKYQTVGDIFSSR